MTMLSLPRFDGLGLTTCSVSTMVLDRAGKEINGSNVDMYR